MAWIVENRRSGYEKRAEPFLTDDLKIDIANKYFPRYPTKRAVLLPALHAIQHLYGWIPMQAIEEVAEFLQMAPAEGLDTASFYEEYWLKPKGQYLLQVCRSLACEICGSKQITQSLKDKLAIDIGETTDDGRFTLVELECLGSCGTAPVLMINELLHENVTVEMVDELIAKLPTDAHEHKDPAVTWETGH